MTKRISVARVWIAIALAAAGLGPIAACGGEGRLSRDAFNDRLQSIDRRGSVRYERLAELAMSLRPAQPLTEEVRQAMRRYAAVLRRAAAQLAALDPPRGAEQPTTALMRALRARASAFGEAAQEERSTLRALERRGSITRAGEQIDSAFEQLHSEGFLSE